MKKFIVLSLMMLLFPGITVADIYKKRIDSCNEHEMRVVLDQESAEHGAVITIVECDANPTYVKKQIPNVVKSCDYGCGEKHQVVKREYFVRETIQTYKPVIQYVPDTVYTRVKPVCDYGC